MNSDIRLAVSFRGHRKRKRLRLLLGPGSTDYLLDLWISTAMNHPGGVLEGMDETDIALEAGWDKEPQEFISALLKCGFLEKPENGAYALHDWEYHQGYVVHAESRKQKARKAAAARWTGNALSIAQAESGNPPLPSPDPLPVPTPTPNPEPFPIPSPARNGRKQNALTALGEDSEAHRLAVLMRDTLKANVPTLKEPNLQAWTHSFAVALRNDERMAEPHFVADVIKWACSDSFWRGNIQSPDKLRKQFDQLTAKMEIEAEKTRTASKAGRWVSPAERRVEANRAACEEAERLLFGCPTPAVVEVEHDAS